MSSEPLTGVDAVTGRGVSLAPDVAGRIVRGEASTEPDPCLLVGPGWTDVQVNGFAGHDVNGDSISLDGFEAMRRALAASGVTRFLPTVITAAAPDVTARLAAIARACDASASIRRAVPGIHLEGPFLSPEDGARGAHPRSAIRDPDRALFDAFQEAAGGLIRLVTLAPERPGALELIAYLRSHGIVVAIGHTLAVGQRIAEAADAGATLSTHLGNGVPTLLPRHPNVIWEQLAEDRLYASAIFDGHHLPPSMMRVLLKVKRPDRLLLTSDAVSLAGRPPGVYEGQVGGTVELHPNGRLTMHGKAYLAGSASSLADGVATAVDRLGTDPRDAIAMVSRVPERLLGLPPSDDLTVVELGPSGTSVRLVAIDGRIAFDSASGVGSP